MKRIAAALVVIALIAATVIGDMGYMGAEDRHSWSVTVTVALIAFALLVMFGDDE